MKTPSITVVIPCYNAGATIASTLESVLRQTVREIEVLVIDDGSRDDGADRARLVANRDTRVQILDQANAGVSTTRNRGAALAKGDLIAFLDSDDLWRPGKLEAHLEHFRTDPTVDVSFARVQHITALGTPTARVSDLPNEPITVESLLYGNPTITTSNVVVRRSVFEQCGGFEPSMSYAEDLEWLVRVCARGGNIRGISDILVDYRSSESSLSSDLHAMEEGWRSVAAEAARHEPSTARRHYRRALARQRLYLARRALSADRRGQAARFLARACVAHPGASFDRLARYAAQLAHPSPSRTAEPRGLTASRTLDSGVSR